MLTMHLFGYQIQYTGIGDVGRDTSALIAPNDRL